MRSVADQLRDEDRQRMLAMTPGERFDLARTLGEQDLALYCAMHAVPPREARLRLQRARQIGRRPSASANR